MLIGFFSLPDRVQCNPLAMYAALEEKMNDLQEVVKKQQEVIDTLTTDQKTDHDMIGDIAAVQVQYHESISNLSVSQVQQHNLINSIDSKVVSVNDEITNMEETVSTLTHEQQSFNIHMHTISSVLISSESYAAEYRGASMGVFDIMKQQIYNKPVYRQRGGTQYIYYDGVNNDWNIFSKLGSTKAIMYASSTSPQPPNTGWKYSGNSQWNSDDLTLIASSPPDPFWEGCTTVSVSSSGPAGIVQADKMGVYRWTGEWLNGSLLYMRDGGGQYLRIATGYTNWRIGSVKDSRSTPAISSGRGTNCPCNPAAGPSFRTGVSGWRYNDGSGNMLVDTALTLTCQ